MHFRKIFLVLLGIAAITGPVQASAAKAKADMRCGWFDNPTPGNATLIDRDGEWLIGEQGGHQAKGEWPVFRKPQWVETNRSYGHGCACMHMTVDEKAHEVTRIIDAHARSISACRKDHAIKEPE